MAGLSAQDLSDRCEALGFPLPRAVLSNLENGRRESVTLAEVIVLARALEISPLQLVAPVGRQEKLELLPSAERPTWDAARWISGEMNVRELDGDRSPEPTFDYGWTVNPALPLPSFRRHDALVAEWFSHRDSIPPAAESGDSEIFRRMLEIAAEGTLLLERRLSLLRRRMRGQGLTPPSLPPELAHIDGLRNPPPVDLRRDDRV